MTLLLLFGEDYSAPPVVTQFCFLTVDLSEPISVITVDVPVVAFSISINVDTELAIDGC